MTKPISLLICALGGEGGGVLSAWLMDVARHADYPAQATSIPGVAQRTGATTYYIEVCPSPASQGNSQSPIFSLNPVPGKLDMIISSELLETARQISLGMSGETVTRVISSSARVLTTQERMNLGDGRADSDALLQLIKANCLDLTVVDMNAMAKSSQTVVSAVMLGAIAGSGVFPFKVSDYQAVMGSDDVNSVDGKSWLGFLRGYELVQMQQQVVNIINQPSEVSVSSLFVQAQLARLPLAAHAIARLGIDRLIEYQNEAYASLYVDRLLALQNTDVITETARWLALWMAYDDIVRVADLKSRASRHARVHSEVKAKANDLLLVQDFFKPGVAEFAALLPSQWATVLLNWDKRRQANGKPAWTLPLKIGTHTVTGLLMLRGLAALKSVRVYGSRHGHEQALIGEWLIAIQQAVNNDKPALALAFAKCGQLIKGYGTTNERGKNNLLHIIHHLHDETVVNAARTAALSDEAGRALDAVLVNSGAPARKITVQPIRWMKKPISNQ